jgi:hypothetical protein
VKQLNKRILHLEMPDRIKRLPISDEGFPVPYFVAWLNGKPEFRVGDPEKLVICVRHLRCWVCGTPLGVHKVFAIGPMCAINRNTAEPCCHYDCALYSVKACPFMSQPKMRRNERDMPEVGEMPGIGIMRNPGVTLLWVTRDYRVRRDGDGVLFTLGDPERVEFYAEGRTATRDEIMHSITTGMPLLRERCYDADDFAELDRRYNKAMELLPAA